MIRRMLVNANPEFIPMHRIAYVPYANDMIIVFYEEGNAPKQIMISETEESEEYHDFLSNKLISTTQLRDMGISAETLNDIVEKDELNDDELVVQPLSQCMVDMYLAELPAPIAEQVSEEDIEQLKRHLGIVPGDPEMLYIVKYKKNMFGAAAFMRPEVWSRLQELGIKKAALLPSSIFEVLIADLDVLIEQAPPDRRDNLSSLVCEVNSEQVKPTQRLSNNAYLFTGEDLSLL